MLCLLAVIFLSGCEQRTLPPKNYKLDEGVMTHLLDSKDSAVQRKDAAAIKGFYAKDVVVNVTGPNGHMFQSTYKTIARQAEINAEYGRDFYTEVLERVVSVSSSQDKAVVQQRIRETWLFHSTFNDIQIESISRMEWDLIDNIPQITKASKRVLNRTILNTDRRTMMPDHLSLNDA